MSKYPSQNQKLTYSASAIFAVVPQTCFSNGLSKSKGKYGLSGRVVSLKTVVRGQACAAASSLEVGWRARLSDPPRLSPGASPFWEDTA